MSHTDFHHPAVAVAHDALVGLASDLTTTAVLVHRNVVGVVLDDTQIRFVVLVEDQNSVWTAPGTIIGSPRPERPRAAVTPDHLPLACMNQKKSGWPVVDGEWPEECWFAVTGVAAEDATDISIVVEGQEHREPIGPDGLAFAIARIRTDDEPTVIVHTRDGRTVKASR